MKDGEGYVIKKNIGSTANPYLLTFNGELMYGALWQVCLWDAPLKWFESIEQAQEFIDNNQGICSKENLVCKIEITTDSVIITPIS